MKKLLILAVVAEISASFGASPAKLIENGSCPYTIVTPKTMSEYDAFVVKDFSSLLAKAVGRELAVVTEDAAVPGPKLHYGIAPADFDRASLKDQERVTVSKGGDLYVFGGGTSGNRYAAYDFLMNTLGFRFFDVRGGMKVPDLSGWSMPDGIRRTMPSFRYRQGGAGTSYNCNGPEAAMFFFRHGYNGSQLRSLMKEYGLMAHMPVDYNVQWPIDCGSVCFVPPDAKFRRAIGCCAKRCGDLFKEHPEYFTMLKDGRRVDCEQRCWSKAPLRDLFAECVEMWVSRFKEPSWTDIGCGDRGGKMCWCEDCAKMMEDLGTPGAPLLVAATNVAARLKRNCPEHRIIYLAYRKEQTQHPPTKNFERMPDNIVVDVAPIADNFMQDFNHPSNTNTYSDIVNWCKLSDNVLCWYYPMPYTVPSPPLGNVDRTITDIKKLHAAGVIGSMFEHNVGLAHKTGFTEFITYAMVRLFDDVTLDGEELVREFTDFEYGAAAEGVRAYLKRLEDLRRSSGQWANWRPPYETYVYLTPERLVKWNEAFEQLAATVSGRELKNLMRIRYNLDLAILAKFNEIKTKLPECGLVYADVEKRVRLAADEIAGGCYTDKFAADRAKFRQWIDERLFLSEIRCTGNTRPLPEELFGGIPLENLFVTLPKGNGCDAVIVPDKKAAFGKTAKWTGRNNPKKLCLPVSCAFEIVRGRQWLDIAKIEAKDLGAEGEYRFYFTGAQTLTPNCIHEIGCYNCFRAPIGAAFTAGEHNRAKFYASLKFEGPAFYPGSTKPNAIYCDRIVVVRDWNPDAK